MILSCSMHKTCTPAKKNHIFSIVYCHCFKLFLINLLETERICKCFAKITTFSSLLVWLQKFEAYVLVTRGSRSKISSFRHSGLWIKFYRFIVFQLVFEIFSSACLSISSECSVFSSLLVYLLFSLIHSYVCYSCKQITDEHAGYISVL